MGWIWIEWNECICKVWCSINVYVCEWCGVWSRLLISWLY